MPVVDVTEGSFAPPPSPLEIVKWAGHSFGDLDHMRIDHGRLQTSVADQ